MFGHCQKLHSLSNWHDCRSLSSHVVPIFRGLAPPPAARAPALDRSLPDRPAFRALLLNAAGTLIFPSEPVSKVSLADSAQDPTDLGAAAYRPPKQADIMQPI